MSGGILHVRAVVRVAAAIALTGCSLAARTMAPDHASHVTRGYPPVKRPPIRREKGWHR